MKTARILLPIVGLLLALPGSAAAQTSDARIPANAAVVAGPTPAGATLVAFARGASICTAIRAGQSEGSATCGPPPLVASQSRGEYGFGREGAHGGVVPDDVARVELRWRGDARTVPTVAGEAYTGPGAGRLRFYLTDGPARQPWLRLFADASGRTLGADELSFEAPLAARPVTLARGSGGGRRWRLRAVSRRSLAATPLDRGRLVNQVCIDMSAGASSGAGICVSPDEQTPTGLAVSPDTQCGRVLLPVLAPRRVRRAEALLGDGRRAPIPLVDVPERVIPGVRAGALVVNGAVAVRAIDGFDATGRRVDRFPLGVAPAKPCGGGSFGSSVLYGSTSPHVLAPRGPLRFGVRDDGVRVCVSLGDPEPRGLECGVPSVDVERASVAVRRAGGQTLLAAVLPSEVAAVEVTVDGRPQRFATAGDVPGYGGQYREVSRFLNVVLDGSPRLGGARMLDAEGRTLTRRDYVELPRLVSRRSRAVRVGGLSLRVRQAGFAPGPRGSYACVGAAGASIDACHAAEAEVAGVIARCAPRRLVVFGAATSRTRRVEVSTSGGVRRARIVRIGDRRVWIAVLAAADRPRRVVTRGTRTRVAPLRLPAAARQCGYSDFAPFR